MSICCHAQYCTSSPETIDLENHSRSEIRHLFLNFNPNTDIYRLARASRRNYSLSVASYAVGGIAIIAGTSLLVELNKIKNDGPGGFEAGMTRISIPILGTLNFSIGGGGNIEWNIQDSKSANQAG